ncbi:MAG: hypothetical protein AB1422_14775 [bacterium]
MKKLLALVVLGLIWGDEAMATDWNVNPGQSIQLAINAGTNSDITKKGLEVNN